MHVNFGLVWFEKKKTTYPVTLPQPNLTYEGTSYRVDIPSLWWQGEEEAKEEVNVDENVVHELWGAISYVTCSKIEEVSGGGHIGPH